MKLGVYGDCHLTKNMRTLQELWNSTAKKSIYHMYNKFDEEDVEMVVCLGDFFDSPRLEAKHLDLVLPILHDINERSYPTYILLGNHEAESEDSNILEMLRIYENIHPITSPTLLEDKLFLPYYVDPRDYDMKDKIVFTHHDIYGAKLAGGKTKAFFGIDPSVFDGARKVFNGHVHLKSIIDDTVLNSGSLLISQQGELTLKDYPDYYIVDSKLGTYKRVPNEYSMIYLTIDEDQISDVLDYDPTKLILKVEYEGDPPEICIDTPRISFRKKISSIESKDSRGIHLNSFDMRNYLVDYIKKDPEVSDSQKEDYITTGLEVLG